MYFHVRISWNSDGEYIAIPQEYRSQGTVVSRNIGSYGDDLIPNCDRHGGDQYDAIVNMVY